MQRTKRQIRRRLRAGISNEERMGWLSKLLHKGAACESGSEKVPGPAVGRKHTCSCRNDESVLLPFYMVALSQPPMGLEARF